MLCTGDMYLSSLFVCRHFCVKLPLLECGMRLAMCRCSSSSAQGRVTWIVFPGQLKIHE